MPREKVRAKAKLPCPVGRGQYMYGVRHKKSEFGTKNLDLEMENRQSKKRKPLEK